MMLIPDHQIIASLLAMPNAPHLLKQVEQQLNKDREKRVQFYNDINEVNMKALKEMMKDR